MASVPRDPRVIEPFLARLGGPDLVFEGKIRSGLLEAGESAVPGLTAALRRKRAPVRFSALAVLEALGEEALEAVSALEECLRDPDEALRERTRQLLAEVRPWCKGDVEFLIASLEERTDESPLKAARVLGGLGPLAALGDADATVRWWAERAIEKVRPAAPEAR